MTRLTISYSQWGSRVVLGIVILSIFSAFCVDNVGAQPSYYRSHYITEDDGLSHAEVNAFYKDSLGFMWIGTYRGLNKFNSVEIEVFNPEETISRGVALDLVEAIEEDTEGNLWLGFHGAGIYVYNRQENTFSNFTDEIELDSGVVKSEMELIWDIELDEDENLWFGGVNGLYFFDREKRKLRSYSPDVGYLARSEPFANHIIEVHCPNKDSIWLATNNGLKLLNPITGEYKVYIPDAAIKKGALFSINEMDFDGANNHYITTFNYGIWKLSRDKNQLEQFIDIDKIKSIQSFHIDQWDRMWIGGQERLFIYDIKTEKFIDPLLFNISKDDIEQTYGEIYSDVDGIVWLESIGKGVLILDPFTNRFRGHLQKPKLTSQFGDLKVSCFYETESGLVYIGTDGGGLYIWDEMNDSYEVITKNNSGLNDDVILTIVPWKNNKLLLGTYQGGFNVLDITSRTFKSYTVDAQDPNSIGDNDVRTILVDNQDRIWVGTNTRGLYRFHFDDERFEYIGMGLENGVISLLIDNDGYLWAGCNNGIKLLDRETGEYVHFRMNAEDPKALSYSFVTDIIQASDGQIYITTKGGGINIFQPSDSSFLHLNESHGLADDFVGYVVEDDKDCLWFGTINGISKYDLKTKKFENFRKEDGLPVNQLFKFGSAGYKRKDGSFLFGAFDGFVSFDPAAIKSLNLLPKIILHHVKVFKRNNGEFIRTYYDDLNEIQLNYDEGSFEIYFDGINYSSLGNTEFRYSLSNYLDSWTYINHQQLLRFAKLPHGKYDFMLQASSDGSRWTPSSTVRIIIDAPYWKEWWFYIVATGMFISLIVGFNSFRITTVKRLNDKLTNEVNKRTNELREVNSKLKESAERISEQNYEIEAQNEELISQNEEIASQRDILEDQAINLSRAKQELDEANRQLNEMNISLEKLVKKRTRKLTKVNKDLDRFVYSASHELVAPIKSLKGLLNLLEMDPGHDRMDEYIGKVRSSVEKLDKVVKNLLDFSRNKGKGTTIENVELKKLTEDIFQELKHINPNVVLANDVDHRTNIMTDPKRLKIILSNLVGNAIKYSDPEKPKQYVSVSAKLIEKTCEISIKDNGEGIHDSQKKRIFEMYYRGSLSSDGSGLGLYIVKEYLKKIKGKIHFNSTYKQGSVFYVELPRET